MRSEKPSSERREGKGEERGEERDGENRKICTKTSPPPLTFSGQIIEIPPSSYQNIVFHYFSLLFLSRLSLVMHRCQEHGRNSTNTREVCSCVAEEVMDGLSTSASVEVGRRRHVSSAYNCLCIDTCTCGVLSKNGAMRLGRAVGIRWWKMEETSVSRCGT